MPNETLIHADVFFFITTIVLVLVSIGVLIALYYVIRILKNARDISDKIKSESTEVISDVKALRLAIKDEGVKWKHVAGLARGFFAGKGRKVKQVTDAITKHK
jgi:ABC-type siderophore export system fused ATPase/permease subunit